MTTCFVLIIWNKGSVPPITSLKIFFRLNCRQRVVTHSTTQPYTFPWPSSAIQRLTCQGTSTTVPLPDCCLPAWWYYLIASYSSSCNLTPPFTRVLIGRHVIFLKSTPSKYKARQKAGFPVITYITLLLRVVLSIYQAAWGLKNKCLRNPRKRQFPTCFPSPCLT